MTRRALTLPEHRLITRALLHLADEYARASRTREQTGDGRSARMRMLRNEQNAHELARLIHSAEAIELTLMPREAFV